MTKNKHALHNALDIGFEAEVVLKKLHSAKKINEARVLELQCQSFLIKLVTKLLQKAPLKYPLVRHMGCLDPRQMAKDCVNGLKHVLKIMKEAKRVSEFHMRYGSSPV